jgi:hypothetical protein
LPKFFPMFSIQIENFGSIAGKHLEKQAFGTPGKDGKSLDATERKKELADPKSGYGTGLLSHLGGSLAR